MTDGQKNDVDDDLNNNKNKSFWKYLINPLSASVAPI